MSPKNDLTEAARRLRNDMPVTEKWAYFDHAAVAPLSRPAGGALQLWLDETTHDGDTLWGDWSHRLEQTRRTAAQLIHAQPQEIALLPNTTAGISLVAEGFPWQAGDNVVTLANEFPSNLYPWLNQQSRGVEVRMVAPEGTQVDLNKIADACDDRTKIVSVSWVGYASGWRLDPAEVTQVAHDHGALLFLDAIQGLGVFPLDVLASGIDFLAADGHKWMLGPEGAGLFYIRQQHLDMLRPLGVGWNSVVHRFDYTRIALQLRPEAARYEGGSHNMAGFLALGASLELLAECGLSPNGSALADCVLAIAAHAMHRLDAIGAEVHSPRDDAVRSGIISFTLPGRDPAEVRTHCLQSGVALACRDGRLRISPHAYNNEEDVERLIAALTNSP